MGFAGLPPRGVGGCIGFLLDMERDSRTAMDSVCVEHTGVDLHLGRLWWLVVRLENFVAGDLFRDLSSMVFAKIQCAPTCAGASAVWDKWLR